MPAIRSNILHPSLSVYARILPSHTHLRHADAFIVFSQAIPSQSLGFIDAKAAEVEITVGGKDLTIRQSRGLLTSNRKEGTTGAGLH